MSEETEETTEIQVKFEATDYLIPLAPIRASHKINSIDISKTLISMQTLKTKQSVKLNSEMNKSKHANGNDDAANLSKMKAALTKCKLASHDVFLQPIVLSFINNMIAIIYLPVPALNIDLNFIKIDEWKQKYLCNYMETNKIQWDGHRTAVRSVCFSSDDAMLVSTCKNSVKIWNCRSLECIRNLDCEYGLKCLFAPGNKHVIVATKQGNILIYDLVINSLIQRIEAHEGEVYSICLTGDERGIVSGGADSCIKIWQFNLKMVDETKQLCLSLSKSVKVQDEVLAVACSADGKYLVVSLLDSTIQIFFFDDELLLDIVWT